MPASEDPDEVPPTPADFSVEDILRASSQARRPGAAAAGKGFSGEPAQEARSALWELDFALQELEWLRREGVDERRLLQSVARQIATASAQIERFPLGHLPLPAQLRESLADRFAQLSDALESLPPGWAGHEDLLGAHARLRGDLERRGVDVG